MKSPLRSLIVSAAVAALLVAPALQAAQVVAQPLANEAKTLPVTAVVAKGEPGPEFGGPYSVTVTNTSGAALKLKATVLQSVVSHNRPKTIELPGKMLEAGGSWKIADLAVEDKVTLSAEGHAPLVVTVEAKK